MAERLEATPHGFRFGALLVEAVATVEGRVIVRLQPDAGKPIDVYCSATGRSLRAFRDGKELVL